MREENFYSVTLTNKMLNTHFVIENTADIQRYKNIAIGMRTICHRKSRTKNHFEKQDETL